MSDLHLCRRCKTTMTSKKNAIGEPQCGSCSNGTYFNRLNNGEIVELKIDMTKVKQSTLLQILAMIKKDMEGAV